MHHLTHIDNLEKIIKKGILSRNQLNSKEYKDTADPSIIEKREELNNYVPFHINHLQIKYGVSYNHTVLESYGKANIIIF